MMNKLPAVFLFVFFMDIKPLYIAHLFNKNAKIYLGAESKEILEKLEEKEKK